MHSPPCNSLPYPHNETVTRYLHLGSFRQWIQRSTLWSYEQSRSLVYERSRRPVYEFSRSCRYEICRSWYLMCSPVWFSYVKKKKHKNIGNIKKNNKKIFWQLLLEQLPEFLDSSTTTGSYFYPRAGYVSTHQVSHVILNELLFPLILLNN